MHILTHTPCMCRNALLESDQLAGVTDDLFSTDAARRRQAGRLLAEQALNARVAAAVRDHAQQHGSDGGSDAAVAAAVRAVVSLLIEDGRTAYPVVASFVDALWEPLVVTVPAAKGTASVPVLQVRHPAGPSGRRARC
jgi:hypothetical protein